MYPTYTKKPVQVEAVQWIGENEADLILFTDSNFYKLDSDDRMNCEDPEATATVFDKLHSTWVLVYDGDYVIKGVVGEFYPCREHVFNATYSRSE